MEENEIFCLSFLAFNIQGCCFFLFQFMFFYFLLISYIDFAAKSLVFSIVIQA